MKNIISVFALGLIVQGVSANEDFLSKFHQSGYKLKDVRSQLMAYDKDCFSVFEIKAFKYNRTTTAHNGTLNFKVNVKDNLEILVQAYKLLSNEYRYTTFRFQVNLKEIADSNALGLGDMKKCGNLTSFYFYKDITYHFCNFVVNEKRFPPLIPNGRYRFDVTVFYFKKEVALVAMYAEIYTPIEYPKK